MRCSTLLVTISFLFLDTSAHADLGKSTCPSAAPVVITRVLGERRVEEAELRLTDCFGQPRKKALIELSLLARPHGVPRPSRIDRNAKSLIASSVRKLDPRLLTRLQALATRWPGKRIEIVSGYRPNAKSTSRHRHGRALDLRVVGVDKEEIVAFAKAIPGTGVGYYPNSVFTHVDVRDEATTWVDHSGPGERARYGKFPENFEALLEDAESSKRAARDAIDNFQTNGLGSPAVASRPAIVMPKNSVREAEGPSSISEGIDTTSALVARETTPGAETTVPTAETTDGSIESGTGAQADTGIAELRRQLTQELSTIDTGIEADTASQIENKPAMASNTQTRKSSDAPAKPIDWSPPW